jgi:hypothetical protein
VSALNSYYVFLKMAKLWELQQAGRHPPPLQPDAGTPVAGPPSSIDSRA